MIRSTGRHVVIVALVLVACSVQFAVAQATPTDAEKAASRKGSDDAWSWGNAFVVKNCVDGLYYPHAVAMLSAAKMLKAGAKPADLMVSLKTLPGIKGVVVHTVPEKSSETVQWPDSVVKVDAFVSILMNSKQADVKPAVAPMMHRTVGGKVKFQRVPMGNGFLDLMVLYVPSETLPIPDAFIALVMDEKWLTAQVPSLMDSLYRENSQLLFCAASPNNKIWEQSLGVTAGTDTLWWVGRKDVKIANSQPLWPFDGIQVKSYVHTLEKK